MKSDLDNQQSSVNDMLEQIKKIMSEEQNSKANNITNESNVLELSEDFIVENGKQTDEVSNEYYYNNTNEIIDNSHDLFNEIDRLIINSDLNQAKNIENNKVNMQFNSDTRENKNKISAINDHAKLEINPEKQTLKTTANENVMETFAVKNIKENFQADDEKRTNLISDNVVKESTQALKELMGAIDKPSDNLKFRNGSTVEELIIEVMKPQISEWLNANLSIIVKKVVEKEVRKLIPREED